MKIESMDVILLGHGSRRGKDTDLGLEEIRRRLQLRFDNGLRVRMAGLEFTPPGLEEAVLKLAGEGSRDILVMPFLLFCGKHLKEEIPQDIERISHLVPHVSLRLTANLGLDSRLVEMVEERIKSALRQTPNDKPGSGVETGVGAVLVRRGSRPEYDAGEELFKLAKDVSQRLNLLVEPAQAQFGRPAIAEAIESLIKRFDKARHNAALKRIIIVPYLLFPGKVLFDNVLVETDKARALYPHIDFPVTPTLGVDERFVDIAMDRIGERLED